LLSRFRPDPAVDQTPGAASVRPDAQPFHAVGGPVGVLLCHGFTGSPQSMRPWAEFLAAQGYTVSLPRLPGHGTRWQELNRTQWQDWYACVDAELTTLRESCRTVFVMGLSMGGTLALRLAEQRGDDVAALVLVNPAVCTDDKAITYLLPALYRWVPSFPGIANDIARPGVSEDGYTRSPLRAAYSMTRMWIEVGQNLNKITCPLLLFRSDVDHVVDPTSARLILAEVRSGDLTERRLTRSYHVATLDYDAEDIFAGSVAFIQRQVASADA